MIGTSSSRRRHRGAQIEVSTFNLKPEGKSWTRLLPLGSISQSRCSRCNGVDARGRTVLRKLVRRDKLMGLIAQLPPCLIGMKACGGAHEWARQFQRHGHRVGIQSVCWPLRAA